MSGFDLVPVDGGEPIHLPPGDTVLGRGPLLGVSDKRVSRHHGLLENLNGQLRLKPTHHNPCFVQLSLNDDPRPLQKDTWFPLSDGDLFSLLPGQFIYRVVAVGEEQATPRFFFSPFSRNSQMFEEEEDELLILPNPDVKPVPPPIGWERGQTPPHEDATQSALSDEANRRLHKDEEAQAGITPPTVYRKRILPGWMMAVTSNGQSSSLKAAKRSKGPVSSSAATQRPAAKQTTPPLATSLQGAGLHEEEEEKRPKMRRRKMSDEEVQATTEFKEERDDFPMEEEEEEAAEEDEGRTSTADRNTTNVEKKPENKGETSQRAKPVGSNSSSVPSAAALKRTPCPYGKDCYRKNPIHFQDCSHPGDPDYKEEDEEEEEADRPECPYGTDCYRKNPLHRKEYKHTKRPARTSRTVAQKPQADDDEDEDGEDDDSFINDDSEDLGDDSDYIPPDSDDSGKEDIKRLQKEAKIFLKKRK